MKTYSGYNALMSACLIEEEDLSRDMVNMILDYAKDKEIPAKAKLKIDE